ncbi:TetR/AcrR family transcriptional regulator [Subtercola vilae]|nr:TetR/AcrR family transcriptional regulator [Subtercola vilae]
MTDPSQPSHAARREALLVRVVDHVLENGISQLTLRELAAAAGSNNRMLLYYFGTRENVIVAALEGAERRFPTMRAIIPAIDDTSIALEQRLTDAWCTISDPANLPFHRLFFEIFGQAGFRRQQFTELLGDIGTEWVTHVAKAFEHEGVDPERSLVFAHEIVALWRGLQATLLSVGDAALVDRAARESTAALVGRLRPAAY